MKCEIFVLTVSLIFWVKINLDMFSYSSENQQGERLFPPTVCHGVRRADCLCNINEAECDIWSQPPWASKLHMARIMQTK